MRGSHGIAFLRGFTIASLSFLIGCDALWGGLTKVNPVHCGANPSACSGGEICNPATSLCEPMLALSAVSPERLPGSAGGRATITGVGFDASLTVLFDGTPAVIEAATDTSLTVMVPKNPQGHWRVPVAVQRPTGTAQTRSDVFSYYAETLSFADSRTGRPQDSVVITDWNRDGFVDVVTSDAFGTNILLLAGQADGMLSSSSVLVSIPGMGARFLRAADFDGDGQVEVLIGGNYGTHIASNPKSPSLRSLSTMSAVSAEVIDLDSDGDIDILLADQRGLSALLNNGSGNFSDVLSLSASQPLAVAATPSKGGGSSELFALGTTQVMSYRFVNRSMVQARTPLAIDGSQCSPLGIAAVWLGSESLPHVLLSCDRGLLRYKPDGSGAYPTKEFLLSTAMADRIVPADYNGDGMLDLFVVDATSKTGVILRAAPGGQGSFTPTTIVSNLVGVPINGLIGVAVGDLEGDGKPDLVLAATNNGGEVLILRNRSL